MSYSVSVSGHVNESDTAKATAAEQAIVNAFTGAIASLPADAGVSFATGTFQYLGTVALLPAAPPPPPSPYAELDAANEGLQAAVAGLNASPPSSDQITAVEEAAAAVATAISDLETATPAPSSESVIGITEAPPAGDVPAPTAVAFSGAEPDDADVAKATGDDGVAVAL